MKTVKHINTVIAAIGVGCLVFMLGCAREDTSQEPSGAVAPGDAQRSASASAEVQGLVSEAEAMERGKAIVTEAFSVLSSNLMAAMQRGGIVEALPYCSVKAIPLTEGISATKGVELRRLSHKPRNPLNRAEGKELEVLRAFEQSLTEGTALQPVVVADEEGRMVFRAPIVLNNPLCLNCHGEPGKDIKSEAQTLLEELYPEDQATGFKLGELRGMWRVRFSK